MFLIKAYLRWQGVAISGLLVFRRGCCSLLTSVFSPAVVHSFTLTLHSLLAYRHSFCSFDLFQGLLWYLKTMRNTLLLLALAVFWFVRVHAHQPPAGAHIQRRRSGHGHSHHRKPKVCRPKSSKFPISYPIHYTSYSTSTTLTILVTPMFAPPSPYLMF